MFYFFALFRHNFIWINVILSIKFDYYGEDVFMAINMDIILYRKALLKTKGGDYMCNALNKLSQNTPIQILTKTGQFKNIPVDLDCILHKLDIYKIPTTFEDLENSNKYKDKGEISGLVLLKGDDVGIFYKKTDSIHRKRFTIAHELAHCCMHGDLLQSGYVEFRSSETSNDPKEIEANTFAGELLIPVHQLEKIYSQLIVPSLKGLADIFEVSTNVMRERLLCLGKPFFDDSAQALGAGDE